MPDNEQLGEGRLLLAHGLRRDSLLWPEGMVAGGSMAAGACSSWLTSWQISGSRETRVGL